MYTDKVWFATKGKSNACNKMAVVLSSLLGGCGTALCSVLNLHSHKLNFYYIFQKSLGTLAAIQSARYMLQCSGKYSIHSPLLIVLFWQWNLSISLVLWPWQIFWREYGYEKSMRCRSMRKPFDKTTWEKTFEKTCLSACIVLKRWENRLRKHGVLILSTGDDITTATMRKRSAKRKPAFR